MSKCKENLKAKRKRRKFYETSLEKKCKMAFANEIEAELEKAKAINFANSMIESMDGILNKRLVVSIVDVREGRQVVVRYTDPETFHMIDNYSMKQFAHDAVRFESYKSNGQSLVFHQIIDRFICENRMDAAAYLGKMAHTIGTEIARHIITKVVKDAGDIISKRK